MTIMRVAIQYKTTNQNWPGTFRVKAQTVLLLWLVFFRSFDMPTGVYKRVKKVARRPLSEEHKRKLSLALKGRPPCTIMTEEIKRKISKTKMGCPGPRKGYRMTLAERRTQSLVHKGINSKGICSEERLVRRSLEYRLWREKVLVRDNYTCQDCGSKKNVCAHHIKNFNDYPELRFVVDNGVTTCRKCHPRKTVI